jgi:hypothetical protein
MICASKVEKGLVWDRNVALRSYVLDESSLCLTPLLLGILANVSLVQSWSFKSTGSTISNCQSR